MIEPRIVFEVVEQCKASKTFYQWLRAVYNWADRNEVEVVPHHNTKWCVKIILKDSTGSFFDFVYPLNKKASEGDGDYEDRVWKALFDECREMRRGRQEFLTKRAPAARAA